MYLTFFGLNEKPFAITPDPRYLYLSERHAEALAHLLYGINEAGGFVQLTGEVGTGKTTIVRSLLAQTPKNVEIALILNPRMTAPEFLLTICEEIGIGVADASTHSLKDLVDVLSRYLLRAHAAGRRVVLVVDEAQNLAPEVLEQVRLLTNLETNTQKLLQIILIGQRVAPRWLPWVATGATAIALSLAAVAWWNVRPWSAQSHNPPAPSATRAADGVPAPGPGTVMAAEAATAGAPPPPPTAPTPP